MVTPLENTSTTDTAAGQFRPVGYRPNLPEGFRPLREAIDEINAEGFERSGIHWLLALQRARSRNRRRRFWRSIDAWIRSHLPEWRIFSADHS